MPEAGEEAFVIAVNVMMTAMCEEIDAGIAAVNRSWNRFGLTEDWLLGVESLHWRRDMNHFLHYNLFPVAEMVSCSAKLIQSAYGSLLAIVRTHRAMAHGLWKYKGRNIKGFLDSKWVEHNTHGCNLDCMCS